MHNIVAVCKILLYANVQHLKISSFLITISYHPPPFLAWYLTSHYIVWCNIISYQYSSDLLANYAQLVAIETLFNCWLSCSYLSMHTIPYVYVQSASDCRFPIYASRTIPTCWLSCSYWYAPVCIICALVDCRFPSMHISLIVLYIYLFFQYHQLILISGRVCTPSEM